MLYVSLNLDGIKPLFSTLTKNEFAKIMRRSANLAAKKGTVKSLDIASEIYNLKKKDLRKRIFTSLNLGTKDEPGSKIAFQFKSIGLERFKPRQLQKSLKVKIFKKEGAVNIRRAFIVKDKNGRDLVFIRKRALNSDAAPYVVKIPKGQYKRSRKGAELPIVHLRAKGLSDSLLPFAPSIADVAGIEGQKELERQLNLILGR